MVLKGVNKKKNYFSLILKYSVLVDKNMILKEFCCIVVSIHRSLFVPPLKPVGMYTINITSVSFYNTAICKLENKVHRIF